MKKATKRFLSLALTAALIFPASLYPAHASDLPAVAGNPEYIQQSGDSIVNPGSTPADKPPQAARDASQDDNTPPVDSDTPSQGDLPGIPQQPADPNDTHQPADPNDTQQPADPDNPQQPADPNDTQQPADPDNLQQTADPNDTQQPANLDNPQQPADPNDTQQPANLDNPQQPEEPDIANSKGHFTEVRLVSNGISLTWKKIAGAKGYYIKRKVSGGTWQVLIKTKGEDVLNYIDSDVTVGSTYYYCVKAYAGSEKGEASANKKVVYLLPPSLTTEVASNGIQLRWNRPVSASGYYVYRRLLTKNTWTKVYTITQPGEISWRDTTAKNGNTYAYVVTTYNGASESIYSNEKSYTKVNVPKVTGLTRKSSTKMKVTWKVNKYASGYQIQYSKNSLFQGVKKVTLRDGSLSAYTLSGLAKKQNYYVRIRTFIKKNGKTYFSAWAASSNVKSTKTAKATILKKGKKKLELRSFAKQVMFQHDVLQGSCTDGTYSYYVLLNKSNYYSKIVKVHHSTRKVVLVSGAMYLGSGNDMTYNPDKNCLVVVQCTGTDPKALISIDPNTLGIIENRHITLPNKLAGGTTSDAKGATAFSGIAYDKTRKQYAVLLSHNYNFILLDAEMNPIQYVKASKKNDYKIQGIDATSDYILVAQSPKYSSQAYNIITVYDWDGNYIAKINAKKGYEIESIFHIGKKYYASFYRSYYKIYYKKVTKKVKVKGRIKKKKVKKKYTKFMRDNYVYRINGI